MKLLTDEPDSEFFGRELTGKPLSSSELASTEVFSALLAKERAGKLQLKDRRLAWHQFQEWVESEQIVLHPLHSRVLTKARHQLDVCHPEIALRTLDAIHLAACDLRQDFPLTSTDGRMRSAAHRLRIPLFPATLAGDNF